MADIKDYIIELTDEQKSDINQRIEDLLADNIFLEPAIIKAIHNAPFENKMAVIPQLEEMLNFQDKTIHDVLARNPNLVAEIKRKISQKNLKELRAKEALLREQEMKDLANIGVQLTEKIEDESIIEQVKKEQNKPKRIKNLYKLIAGGLVFMLLLTLFWKFILADILIK